MKKHKKYWAVNWSVRVHYDAKIEAETLENAQRKVREVIDDANFEEGWEVYGQDKKTN